MFKNKSTYLSLGIALSVLTTMALGEPAPVENLSSSSLPGVDASALPLPDRVGRVEQQVQNLTQMNLPQQIADLQQQIQQLRGQLQELAHQQDLVSQQQQRVEALPAVPPVLQTPPNPAILTAAKPPPSDDKPAGVPPQTDAAAYQQAFSLLANKQYDQSAEAFKAYLRRHPDGQFVANAHYWLGDIYFQQKNLTQAELELNLVVVQYAASGKAPDARLKLALIHAQQGKTEQARKELRAIMTAFPGTPAAQLANLQLQQLSGNSQ